MNYEPSDLDDQIFEQMQKIIMMTLDLVMKEKPLGEYLNWAQSSIPTLAPVLLENFSAEEKNKMAYWIGVNLWSSAPNPSNHFKPDPLPSPSRNEHCPCGSAKKYKHCCSHLPKLMPIELHAFWMLLPQIISKSKINQLIKNQQLPVHAIAIIASLTFETGDNTQVIKLLDPLFKGQASQLDQNQSGLLDILCDSYDAHYKTNKKKKDLLQRMSQHKDRSIRAEAWQRTSSWQLDMGDLPAAMSALSKAMQAEPENPTHSLLELTLLVSSKQIEQAKQRAMFWRRKLKHLELEFPELINTLERAQTDPAGALQFSISETDDDPRLMLLLQWIDEQHDLPLVNYLLEKVDMSDEDEVESTTHEIEAYILDSPESIFELEMQWEDIKPIEKPFGTQLDPMSEMNIWEDSREEQWMAFLQQNPDAINSLTILDDLVTLIYMHPNNDSVWGPLGRVQPLLNRNNQIIRQLSLDTTQSLPWLMPQNQPALRLLTHDINLAISQDEQAHSIKQIKLYLQINPHDNHGYRGLLINYYLQQNENMQALEFASDYLDDSLAETRYGAILALYRLDHLKKAEQLLQVTLNELPLVAQYLIKARVAQPELNPFAISYGGDDQAWFYREEMRESWKQTKGCLQWLKKQLKT